MNNPNVQTDGPVMWKLWWHTIVKQLWCDDHHWCRT